MYADDTCVTIASENLDDLITDVKNDLENISNWMRITKLSLNASKSEFMVIGHRRKLNRVGNELSNLVLIDAVIKRVEKIKYLGINIDESLNWEKQYNTVKNKLKGGISSLRKLKDILPQRKLEQVYKAFFESHLRYGDIVWNALSNTKLSKLQRLQIRASKLIENAKYKDGWNCNWLDVKSLISFDQGVMTYKILHGLCPDNLRHKFVERSMVSEFKTRNHRDLQMPKVRLEYTKRSFYFSGVKNWNDIPGKSENKSHSLVSKRDSKRELESTSRTCKTQTRLLGRAAIYSIYYSFFLIIVTRYSFSFLPLLKGCA